MKKYMIYGVCALSSMLILSEPMRIQAAEAGGSLDNSDTSDVHDIFSEYDGEEENTASDGKDKTSDGESHFGGWLAGFGQSLYSSRPSSEDSDLRGTADAGARDTDSADQAGQDVSAGEKNTDQEITTARNDSEISDSQDLLTAGIGDLFISPLSKVEYVEIAKKAEGALWGYTHLGICNVQENNLNVRQEPDESGKLVGKLPKNAACEIVSSENGWAYITSGKVKGYVKEEYLLTGYDAKQKGEELASAIAVSVADGLNIREEPNTDAEVVTQVASGEILDIVEIQDDGWIRVYLDDEEVYVSGDYVEVKSDLNTAITMTELLYGQGVSDVRVDLCQYAKQYLGNPYVWGGTSLTKGADCSGFVLSVFGKYGVSLPHSSRAQANMGTSINASQLQPGDLVFYAKGGTINHVAIYIGGGQVIHASSPKTGIKISSYNYRTPSKMVRILRD